MLGTMLGTMLGVGGVFRGTDCIADARFFYGECSISDSIASHRNPDIGITEMGIDLSS